MVRATALWAFVALTASSALAAPQNAKRFLAHSVHEERHVLPSNWARSQVAPLNKRGADKESFILPIRINLAQNNVDKGHDILMDISDPESPRYSDHLSPHDIAKLFAPSSEAVDQVLEWLLEAGHDVSRAENYDEFKGAITVKMPMSAAERLLEAIYEVYEHGPTGTHHVACNSYSVPVSIKHHIDFITPTTHFDVHVAKDKHRHSGHKRDVGTLRPGEGSDITPKIGGGVKSDPQANAGGGGGSGCDQNITPNCLRALYGINYTPKKNIPNAYGIVEYTPQSYVASDLDMFFNTFAKSLVGHRPLNKSIDGGVLVLDSAHRTPAYNAESNLDLQYGMALVAPQPVNLYQTGDPIIGSSFNTFLDAFDGSYCKGDDPSQDPKYPDTEPGGYKGNSCGVYQHSLPKVVSTSYGYSEVDLSPSYEKRQCTEYMKLGLLGVTFVFATGDDGVAGVFGRCIDTQTGESSSTGTRFSPTFPATCPYITAVGATEVYPGKSTKDPEGAANKVIYSGGGFSNVFSMPTYQKTAVTNYFKQHKPPYSSKQYNNSGKVRGYPDISANGVNYVVALEGQWKLIYGTSASAPVVGAIFSLINAKRAEKGKKSIGFVNPTLYGHPEMFNDIKFGNNPGCKTQGFSAVSGWDPVTGLGTPKFQKMVDVFANLP